METALSRAARTLVALPLAAILTVAAPASAAAPLPAKPAELFAKLHARVQAVDARLDGVLGVYVEDLTSGTTVELRADEPFPTASSIKPAVFYELYR